MAKKKRHRGRRFRLLIYEQMWKRWALLCLLIIPASFVLWWVAPFLSITDDLYRALALVPALVSLVLLVFVFLARRLAWVQCRPNHLRIRAPFYPLAISYGRIKEVLPNTFAQVFDPAEEKAARRNWLRPYWHRTVLWVKLSKFPVSKAWLRLWFSPYLLSPDTPGFILLVEDWMELSRQIDDFRNAWQARRARRRQGQSSRRTW